MQVPAKSPEKRSAQPTEVIEVAEPIVEILQNCKYAGITVPNPGF